MDKKIKNKEIKKEIGIDGSQSTILVELQKEIKRGDEASIINVVRLLVEFAQYLRASDIHIDPQELTVKARFRIDGLLQDVVNFPESIHAEIISRIKILANLRTDEHQAPQDGRFCMGMGADALDIRVSIIPTHHGENAVLRLLRNQNEDCGLGALGFSPEDAGKILRAIKYPYGMILATGPTGSGKTTTLYTLIKMLNNPETSIITIEDPIEYSLEGINQIGVNPRTGLTFADGLRSILRQDPNVIMVGEIRDQETAGLAVNAALTGHLVLSTVHTNDAATTLPRLVDLKVEPFLIASTVNIAIGQRLVRKVCKFCKKEIKITPLELKSLSDAVPKHILEKQNIFYKGEGCSKCNNSGYFGRTCINEVLVIDDKIREAILKKATASEIREHAARYQKMTSMLEDGFNKAKEGITTIEEILRTFHG